MNVLELKTRVEALASGEGDPRGPEGVVLDEAIAALDEGVLRVAQPDEVGGWKTNAWLKTAILLYFRRRQLAWVGDPSGLAPAWFDKVPIKHDFEARGVRTIPPAVARYGSFLARGVVLMPCYVNIGAYVGEGSMIDTWATVGSCAQIGSNVHLSGGVGIGGVLEPAQAQPVIVEDGAFIGSRCIVVEGVRVEREAVLGAGVILTASTPIVDVTGPQPITMRGRVPARSVVIPGSFTKRFAAGEYGVPCALIVGERNASTDRKTSLETVLREFEVAV
ncbi:MAG TPA: 2,3,4,5-tetrahydropyridine-2,6-dicarboxylate N-succinyltransferase [Candidatus Dormibacteraeota bacterium]|nr:2,3,4,5-tetrahydropyridine-2,6-dicarboxylate N-succinyltransferase [Candidatus Dormibacteraeota bacterium]